MRAETRHLLEGEEYDRSIISSRDAVARQTIAAELLAALAGRNPQRRERAGVAFVEQGYFNETARDLREADAPAERAAAARSLALLGDRAATPHLIVALEDQNPDVRRAAVEALGSLRDPAAVAHLEALLERERNERHRIPPRVIRAAADSCRDDDAELDAEVALAEPLPAVERMPDIKAALVEVDAGEWFDFDMSELREELRPAASAVPEAEYEVDVLESSSGEAFAPLAVAAEETTGFETTHFADSRELGPSYAEETAREEIAPATVSEAPAPPAAQHAPVEKGGALFNEHSTVPTSIQQRLASGDAGERAAAIIELSRVDTDEAFQQICAGFDDPSKDVRNAAARSLYELRPDRAESFTRALREASPERRREIGTAISASGLAVESISQLTGESREKTYEAFSLLFLMAKAGEVQPLVRAIESHPNNEVRLAVVKLLALSGQQEVLPSFRRLAVRGSLPSDVRSAVMEAIYQISSSQPTPGSGSPEDMGT
ncbi:MAG TPA: HEAT repeat domain-containing protein [Pyrinomonadaceae bacterium]